MSATSVPFNLPAGAQRSVGIPTPPPHRSALQRLADEADAAEREKHRAAYFTLARKAGPVRPDDLSPADARALIDAATAAGIVPDEIEKHLAAMRDVESQRAIVNGPDPNFAGLEKARDTAAIAVKAHYLTQVEAILRDAESIGVMSQIGERMLAAKFAGPGYVAPRPLSTDGARMMQGFENAVAALQNARRLKPDAQKSIDELMEKFPDLFE